MCGGRSELFANKLSLPITQSKLSQKIRERSILFLILPSNGDTSVLLCIDTRSFPAATATWRQYLLELVEKRAQKDEGWRGSL